MKAGDNYITFTPLPSGAGVYTTTTNRDELAKCAMQGYLINHGIVGGISPTHEDIARYSYEMADAMIEESEK